MNPSIFLSYRRDDSRDAVGRICDRLAKELGDENVFLDVDSIPLGVDFRRILRKEVSQCHVFIAVIGPAWLIAADHEGQRRLADPDDFVRIEVEVALERGTPVILVLVGGARVPPAEELPTSLRKMADCAAISLDTGTDFHRDIERLITAVRTAPPPERELTRLERFPVSVRQGHNRALAGAVLGLLMSLTVILVRTIPGGERLGLALAIPACIAIFGQDRRQVQRSAGWSQAISRLPDSC